MESQAAAPGGQVIAEGPPEKVAFDTDRQPTMAAIKFAEGLQGLAQLKESLGEANPVSELMQSIESTSRECRKQNEINGLTVQQSSQEIRSKIAILHGGAIDPEGYDSDGDVASNKTSNILGRA